MQSTATLACIGRRQKYFKDEFLSALEILHRGDLRPEQMRGSWAGAFGPTQFMPTAFKRYAVDADGDGRRDVVDDPADLIASTANNLKKDGWQTGQTWGYEVVVPQGFNYMLADRAKAMTIAQWEHLGLKRANGQPFPHSAEKAYLLAPAGAEGPGFLMLQNFRVIMKYNPAEAYALAIGHFADRLRGGPPFVQPWPRQERELSRAERLELQQLLAQRGFYRGTPDGQFGGQTREALRGFQASIGAPADGFASSDDAGAAPGALKRRIRPPKLTLNTTFRQPALTTAADAGSMIRNLPACGLIPLVWRLPERPIATEPHAKDKILFPGVHRDRPADRRWPSRSRCWSGSLAPASAQFFNFGGPPRPQAAPPPPGGRAPGGWFGGDLFAPFQQQAPKPVREFFQGTTAGKARDHTGSQRAGARRRHGGLARLWS